MPSWKLAGTIYIHSGVLLALVHWLSVVIGVFQDLALGLLFFFLLKLIRYFFCWWYSGEQSCLTNWYLLLIHRYPHLLAKFTLGLTLIIFLVVCCLCQSSFYSIPLGTNVVVRWLHYCHTSYLTILKSIRNSAFIVYWIDLLKKRFHCGIYKHFKQC